MGEQKNVAEAEHNNTFFGEYFRAYLKQHNPDVVHFFHLHRMSASMIDACYEANIPTVMTPTDFWLVCPTFQLLLPDNTLCAGPDAVGVNCLRHVVSLSQSRVVNSTVSLLPDRAVGFVINKVKRAAAVSEGMWSYVQALSRRPDFLRDRFKKLDRVLVPSRHLERILKDNGFTSDNVVFCPYGINLSHAYQEKSPGPSPGSLQVGFIGSLLKHKGAHILARALSLLPRDEPVEVKIYGNMEENPVYVNEIKRMIGDDPRAAFCGTFPNSQIGAILAGIDVLVVPSVWHENTPLVIYSAQAAGCPVIASNHGGMAEIIHHNDNGILFEPGSASELAEVIKRLARDRDLLVRLSKKTTPKSISQYVEELVLTYREILTQRMDV
jgi:glycosyltransferase involved in cell wall biosynthesis